MCLGSFDEEISRASEEIVNWALDNGSFFLWSKPNNTDNVMKIFGGRKHKQTEQNSTS